MLPNTPQFNPSLHTPDADLNRLAALVREQSLTVAPPLVLEQGPFGQMLRLDQDTTTSAESHTAYQGFLPNSAIFPNNTLSTNLFTFTEVGVYLVTGAVSLEVTTPPASFHYVQVVAKLDTVEVGQYLHTFPDNLYCQQTLGVALLVTVATAGAVFKIEVTNPNTNTANFQLLSPGGGSTRCQFLSRRLFI